jgi:hypothetical protein
MHLTSDQRFLANATDDPLHDAFDRKLAVHAMPRNETLEPDQLEQAWSEMMSAEHTGQPVRTIYIKMVAAGKKPLAMGFGGDENNLLFREISYQVELGYCDCKALSIRYQTISLPRSAPW